MTIILKSVTEILSLCEIHLCVSTSIKPLYTKIVHRLSRKGLKEALVLNVSAMSGHMEKNSSCSNKQNYLQ